MDMLFIKNSLHSSSSRKASDLVSHGPLWITRIILVKDHVQNVEVLEHRPITAFPAKQPMASEKTIANYIVVNYI